MPYTINTIPGDFPLGYVLAPVAPDDDGVAHQLYVKERWRGASPECDYADVGGRNADGSVGEYWQIGCLIPGCDAVRGSVLTTNELLRELRLGRIVGTYHNGIVVIV